MEFVPSQLRDCIRDASFSYDYISILALGVLLLALFVSVRKKPRGFPPGPTGLPVVGYLPFLSKDIHLDLVKLGKKYGDVYSVQLGTESVVVLHGAGAIREALGKPEFLGRPPHSIYKWMSEYSPFFVQNINVWKEHRRFVVHAMKDLGLGKSKIEGDIKEEIFNFLEVLKSQKGAPMDVKGPLSSSMSNNICALVFGKRLEYDDPERRLLDSNLETESEAVGAGALATFFPWLRHVPRIGRLLGLKKALASADKIKDFFRQEIAKHRQSFNRSNIRDFIDHYLIEMESKKKDPETTFNDEVLVGAVLDLFGAGSETVSTSILWCVYAMAAYPNVQRRVQREIEEVLGDRRPDFQDQRRLPYTQATILEVMRWKTIVAINIMRFTTADTTVGRYRIPKGTIVLANFWAVHHDPEVWEDPEDFRPERFLSPDGAQVVKPPNYMPFSIGKRACPGETMAHMELFLYFTSILSTFDVAFPDGVTPTFDATLTITYRLDPFEVRFVERKCDRHSQ